MGKIFEIINAKIDNSSASIELELLETSFKGKMKKIGKLQGHTLDNIKNGDIVSSELIDDITEKQEELEIRIAAYEANIVTYAATKDIQITFETRTKQEFSKEYASFELLNELVSREEDLIDRIQNIRKVLGNMAMLQVVKDLEEFESGGGKKVLDIHPSMKIIAISEFDDIHTSSDYQGFVYSYSGFKVKIYNLNSDFTVGEKLSERIISVAGNNLRALPAVSFKFTSLGDYAVLKYSTETYNENIHAILDFTEYGLALSPNWQGVTLDIIERRG